MKALLVLLALLADAPSIAAPEVATEGRLVRLALAGDADYWAWWQVAPFGVADGEAVDGGKRYVFTGAPGDYWVSAFVFKGKEPAGQAQCTVTIRAGDGGDPGDRPRPVRPKPRPRPPVEAVSPFPVPPGEPPWIAKRDLDRDMVLPIRAAIYAVPGLTRAKLADQAKAIASAIDGEMVDLDPATATKAQYATAMHAALRPEGVDAQRWVAVREAVRDALNARERAGKLRTMQDVELAWISVGMVLESTAMDLAAGR